MTLRAAALLVPVVALAAILLATGPEPPVAAAPVQDPGGGGSAEPAVPLFPEPVLPDTSLSIDRYILAHLDAFETPELRARKAQRRKFQRAGYANVLHDVLALDAAGALLSFIRCRLQVEYSLPHNTIYFQDTNRTLWPLPEDWTFPADPWAD